MTLVLLECDAAVDEGASLPMLKRLGPAVGASLRRPVILAPLCGLVLPLTGQHIPMVAASALDLVGKATVGLALFLTGLILSAQRLQVSGAVVSGVLLKNVVQSALVFALIVVFHVRGDIAREAFLLAAVPAGFFGTVFGARYGVSSREASSTLVLSTCMSLLTLPAAILLSGYLG
jgi:predicted permease